MLAVYRKSGLRVSQIPHTLSDMQNATSEIADRVRGISVEKRFTHDRIAAVTKLSRSSVSSRMNGQIPWTATELLILAAVMRVPVARFFPEPSRVAEFAPTTDALAVLA